MSTFGFPPAVGGDPPWEGDRRISRVGRVPAKQHVKERSMSSWKPLFAVAIAAALAALWSAPGASATVYCVDDTPGELADNGAVDPSCETAQATIAAAVTTAESHAGPDSVLIGPGEFTLTPVGSNGAYYNGVAAENTLQVRGAGAGSTHLTMGSTAGSQVGLWAYGPAGSTLSDFELTIPANSDGTGDKGIVIGGAVLAERVKVDGPDATNATGVLLGGGSPSLRRSQVQLPVESWPTDTAVMSPNSGNVSIVDSSLSGSSGVVGSGGTVTVERSAIDARTGVSTDSGAIVVRDSLIDLGARSGATGVNAANFNAGNKSIQATVDGVTIVGGGSNSVGVRAQADNGEEATSATVDSTEIEGPARPLQVLADNGRTAGLSVSHSNLNYGLVQVSGDLNGSGETGTADYEEAEVTDLAPGFVDAAAGDYRLAAGSALIDLGDPAPPAAEERDLAGGPRDLAGTCAAAPRRDIGAYEFAPTCAEEAPSEPAGSKGTGSQGVEQGSGSGAGAPPETAIKGPRRVATAGRSAKVRLWLSATGEATGFRCEVDGKVRACGPTLKLRLKRGRHTIKAWALGAAGSDPSPARIVIRVVAKRPAQA
jgi:hypothetical protein